MNLLFFWRPPRWEFYDTRSDGNNFFPWPISRIFFFIFSKFWFCWSLEGYKNKKWLKITKKFCLSCPYPKNHILYDHNLWYPSVKWYVSRLFIIFLKMLIFRVVRKVKGQNDLKWQKSSVRCALYPRNHTSCELHLWFTCVKRYLQEFFYIFPKF